MGLTVLYADVDVVLTAPPFEISHNDSDVEILSEAWDDEAGRGFIHGSDDPSMGWGRYAESMRIAFVSPALVYLQPTFSARALTTLLATMAYKERWRVAPSTVWEAAGMREGGEAYALTFELFAPAHDSHTRIGAKVRVLHRECFLTGRTAHATLADRTARRRRPGALLVGRHTNATSAAVRARAAVGHFHSGTPLGTSWAVAAEARGVAPDGSDKLLPPRWAVERTMVDGIMDSPPVWKEARDAALRTRCRGTLPPERMRRGLTRPLHMLVPAESDDWPPRARCIDESLRDMCAVVKRVAIKRAILAAVANKNIAHDRYLGQFTELAMTAGVKNLLVVALDNTTGAYLERRGVPHYVRHFRTRTGASSETTDNHATSALKFAILSELLSVGVSVLLSDVDVPILQDPFAALYRDCDIENMSDGWDDASVYGFEHTVTLPNEGGHGPLRSLRYETRNSGFFYIAATEEGLRTVQILKERMAHEAVWDQSAWNQETFRVAVVGSAHVAGASVRAMNYLCVLNTKVLFRFLPKDPQLRLPSVHLPTCAHMNYHPEKEPRMAATIAFYRQLKLSALAEWNGGEGRRTGTCKHKVGVPTDEGGPPLSAEALANHTLAHNIYEAGLPWAWGPRHSNLSGPIWFRADGNLQTPWGNGSWGTVAGQWRRDALRATLNNATYLLMFLSEKWAFVSVRCSDEDVSYGRVSAPSIPMKRLVW